MRHIDLHLAAGRGRRSCGPPLPFLPQIFLLVRERFLDRHSDVTVISEELTVVLSESDVQGSRATLSEERWTLPIQTKSESVFVNNCNLMSEL